MYQLWLDALYPKAKFGDGLAIIEKLGHTKRMQLLRRDWINEGKVQVTNKDASNHDQTSAPIEQTISKPSKVHSHKSNITAESTNHGDPNSAKSSTPDHTLNWPPSQDPNEELFVSEKEDEDLLSDDDLDAIHIEDILEDPSIRKSNFGIPQSLPVAIEHSVVEFDDEMEAMASTGNL